MQDKLIRVSAETHKCLTNLGKKGQTYAEIVERVLDDAEKWRIVRDEFLGGFRHMATEERWEFMLEIETFFKERGLITTDILPKSEIRQER